MNLPDDIILIIYEYIKYENKIKTRQTFKEKGKQIMNFILSISMCLEEQIKELKQIHIILKKYNMYQNYYDYYIKYEKVYNYKNPLLIDMFFSGCSIKFAYPTFKYYNKNIENDILIILKMFPETIHSTFGQLENCLNVCPLVAACINENIPIYMIKKLLFYGAYKRNMLLVNGEPVSITNYIKDKIDNKRMIEIKKLLDYL